MFDSITHSDYIRFEPFFFLLNNGEVYTRAIAFSSASLSQLWTEALEASLIPGLTDKVIDIV